MTAMARSLSFGLALLSATALAQEIRSVPVPIRNWQAPPYWRSAGESSDAAANAARGAQTGETAGALVLVPSPMPFIGLKPCRIADTRAAAFPDGYGPPSMSANVSRNFILAGQCGIPDTAQAVSLNITVTGAQGTGYILIYPQGGNAPGVSTLNFTAGQTLANAAIVPLGNGGGVTVVAVVAGTQLLIDTNGFYGPAETGIANTFLGTDAGGSDTTGENNTAFGFWALKSDTTGDGNTAVGVTALRDNTTGGGNTAIGAGALSASTTGNANTAEGDRALGVNTVGGANTGVGSTALGANVDGNFNTAMGTGALAFSTTGDDNAALGSASLRENVSGNNNVAVGSGALTGNVGGSSNSGIGYYALWQSTGSLNIGLGSYAGTNLTSGDNNLYIGNEGIDGESNTIRIGSGGSAFFQAHTRIFAAAINGTNVGFSSPVMVNALGQLGTVTSSARYKEEIRDMGETSERILKLRPVTFRYRGQPEAPVQFGLIAEEVEKVVPELVVRSADGQPESVMYHELPAMLVNELQKQQRQIESQRAELREQRERLEKQESEAAELRARVAALEAASIAASKR